MIEFIIKQKKIFSQDILIEDIDKEEVYLNDLIIFKKKEFIKKSTSSENILNKTSKNFLEKYIMLMGNFFYYDGNTFKLNSHILNNYINVFCLLIATCRSF